jgi:hypothetical protein
VRHVDDGQGHLGVTSILDFKIKLCKTATKSVNKIIFKGYPKQNLALKYATLCVP